MSTSKLITRNDLRAVLNDVVPIMETEIANEAEGIAEAVVPDAVDDYVSSSAFTSAILDVFYPVGCYFETSDTTFNPNTSWGGTWALLPQHNVVSATASPVTLAANSDTEVCTITLDANTKYIILGGANTGSTASMTSNCDISCKSGTYHTLRRFITNSVTATAGSNLNASAYIHTDTSCVVVLKKYNYTSSAITTGGGSIVAIPLTENDGRYHWHRTA